MTIKAQEQIDGLTAQDFINDHPSVEELELLKQQRIEQIQAGNR